ncbi:MAG: protein phosphatase regulatory subunit Sds22 [Ramalina farinacea]|uniref:Protein phosphatase regulatory subunit Sds22 n=1 Tax=Ramalina farinacea TaxID=258253 RepID=A0AA43TXV4_9LECA|nr:protein phosphatase regulatory subunit Sds22 [Ramalina farinacea]
MESNEAAVSNGQQPRPALSTNGSSGPRDSKGWDGKLRVDKKAVLANPEALSDPDYSDEDAPAEIDLVHCRISSLPALRLERFHKVERLCLRQNQISQIEFPEALGPTLQDLDLYDNLISHIKGLEQLIHLTSLDLSFNKIKHIKHLNHLEEVTDLYLLQNRISKIEGLDGMTRLRNLELAANRIREVENLETLVNLEELWLGKNKIVEINVTFLLTNISHLQNLKILSIQSNRLTKITGVSELPNLEEIYISHNALTEISGLDNNTNLRILDISNNQIRNLSGFKSLTKLEELWASSNLLDSFEEVEEQLRDKKDLNTVYFEANPLQLRGPAVYRNKVKLALPNIEKVDATYVK